MNLVHLPSTDSKYFQAWCKNCGVRIRRITPGMSIEVECHPPLTLCLDCLSSLKESLSILGPNQIKGKKGAR